MKRGRYFLAFWEMVLLIGSIPVFRSVWMLMDKFDSMNSYAGIAVSFLFGALFCVMALLVLNRDLAESSGRQKQT